MPANGKNCEQKLISKRPQNDRDQDRVCGVQGKEFKWNGDEVHSVPEGAIRDVRGRLKYQGRMLQEESQYVQRS